MRRSTQPGLLAKGGAKLVLPEEVVIADAFDNDAVTKVIKASAGVPEGWRILDISPSAVEQFRAVLKDAKTVVWNGPMGVFEMSSFAKGTYAIAEVLAESAPRRSSAARLGGGSGDLPTACRTSRPAAEPLELLEGKALPGVVAQRPLASRAGTNQGDTIRRILFAVSRAGNDMGAELTYGVAWGRVCNSPLQSGSYPHRKKQLCTLKEAQTSQGHYNEGRRGARPCWRTNPCLARQAARVLLCCTAGGNSLMRKPIIAGNWKMYKTPQEAVAFVNAIKDRLAALTAAERVVCPPYVALPGAGGAGRHEIAVGAQDVHWQEEGAYTSQIAPGMLKGLVKYVIIGHSETREYLGITDEMVNKKAKAALAHGLHPIIAVGESLTINEAGQTQQFVGRQIRAAFDGIPAEALANIVVAYEPIWAIGTGKSASGEQANAITADPRSPGGTLRTSTPGHAHQYGGGVAGQHGRVHEPAAH